MRKLQETQCLVIYEISIMIDCKCVCKTWITYTVCVVLNVESHISDPRILNASHESSHEFKI